jgi:hypothetical protein
MGEPAVTVARRALFAAAVHLYPGGVEIDRHQLGPLAPERAIQMLAHARARALDPLTVHTPKVLGALQRGRRRRRRGDRPQPAARLISADLLQIGEELAADQLALRERDHQLPRREPPPADLHRPRPALDRQLRIDELHQPQPPGQLAGHRQPRVAHQRRIALTDHDPSAPPATVNGRHPHSDLPSPTLAGVSTPPELQIDQTESPVLRGFPPSAREYPPRYRRRSLPPATATTH